MTSSDDKKVPDTAEVKNNNNQTAATDNTPKEIGGRKGPEPTRYGDWEKNGLISDF